MLHVQECETSSTGLPKQFFFWLTFHKGRAASSDTFPGALHCAQEDPVLHQCVSRKEEEEQEVGGREEEEGRKEGREEGGGRKGGREEGRKGGGEEEVLRGDRKSYSCQKYVNCSSQ